MEKKLLLPALALSLLSCTVFAAGTNSDSSAAVNKFTMPSFDEMDANHDGMMDKSEYDSAMAKMDHDSMGKDGTSHDSMGYDSASKDSISKGDDMSHDSMSK